MTNEKSAPRSFWRQFLLATLEVALIFGVFAVYGAWPTPDVNEQYYIGKAIHFWRPDWLGNDPFLCTPDSHWLFYATFGLLSFLFSPDVLIWAGRILVWFLTALSWRRLSRALLPVPCLSVLTAACFAYYLESFHLAGEWIIGGVEGKSFAFPFVFWGLACFTEGKFGCAWVLYGIGSAFHVLVGGWAVLASMLAYAAGLIFRRRSGVGTDRAALGRSLAGLFVGGACSLAGLIPALLLDRGASPAVIDASRRIYVFRRLSHHLVASSLPWTFQLRFALLVVAFLVATALVAMLLASSRKAIPASAPDSSENSAGTSRRFFLLNAFVLASVLFAGIGCAIDWGSHGLPDPESSARFLRYYWYRLSDWAVPLGLVMASSRLLVDLASIAWERLCRGGPSGQSAIRVVYGSSAALAVGFGIYWAFRHVFYGISVRVALTKAIEGAVPPPKPTEDVSLMAAFVTTGAILILAYAVLLLTSKRFGRGRRALAVGTGLWLAFVCAGAPASRLAYFVDLRGTKVIPRSEPPKESIADGWRETCQWVRDNTPEDAIFLVPRGCDSFKWLARRAEAGSWKEIPQDARSIVDWYDKMELFYANPGAEEGSPMRWNQALNVVFINKGRKRVLEESAKAGYDYVILEAAPYTVYANKEAKRRWLEFVDNDCIWQNQQFVVLKLKKDESGH